MGTCHIPAAAKRARNPTTGCRRARVRSRLERSRGRLSLSHLTEIWRQICRGVPLQRLHGHVVSNRNDDHGRQPGRVAPSGELRCARVQQSTVQRPQSAFFLFHNTTDSFLPPAVRSEKRRSRTSPRSRRSAAGWTVISFCRREWTRGRSGPEAAAGRTQMADARTGMLAPLRSDGVAPPLLARGRRTMPRRAVRSEPKAARRADHDHQRRGGGKLWACFWRRCSETGRQRRSARQDSLRICSQVREAPPLHSSLRAQPGHRQPLAPLVLPELEGPNPNASNVSCSQGSPGA